MMSRTSIAIALALLAAGATLAQTAASFREGESRVEKEVRGLEEQLARAAARGARDFFDRRGGGASALRSHTGAFKTKAQWMAESKFSDARQKSGIPATKPSRWPSSASGALGGRGAGPG